MKHKTKILSILALLLMAVTQGAWAQADWEAVYAMTQTTAANWTALSEGSTTGRTLGSAGNTTYYYATGNLTFTNSNGGGSGLTILGTVYLYVPEGVTVTCTGANANGQTGGGAGIELTSGNTLYLIGGGTINATGGNAANGGRGGNGGVASGSYSDEKVYPGNGGAGGHGGGGAGAGIGTRGGNGGAGGSGGVTGTVAYETDVNGASGGVGSAGATADAMGNLYVVQSFFHLSATGGSKGTVNGSGGSAGGHFLLDLASNQTAAGGAGGGGGGYGGAASNIGTGGPGGGGGGGGSGGSARYKHNPGYYRVGSTGGGTGMDADGSWHSEDFGTSTEMTGTQYFNNDNFSDEGYDNGSGAPTYADGGACGNASSAVSIKRALATDASGNYLICNAADWDGLSALVAEGNTFSGKTVILTVDISVSEMVGSSEDNSFQGTFDGQGHTLTFTKGTASDRFSAHYCAPFRYVNGATIQNLKVTGNIYTSGWYVSGIVAYCFGTTSFTNCHAATVIHDKDSELLGLHGGIVGRQGGPLNITGCTFTGRLLTSRGSANCGGFVGLTNKNAISISNSLYAPDVNIPLAEDEATIIKGNTFVQADDLTFPSCYYTEALGTAQGTQAYVFASAPDNLGSLVQDYGMVKAYENGILYDGKYYVRFTLSGEGTEASPYIIAGTDNWNLFAQFVNNGSYNLNGMFVKLTADIAVSEMVGTSESNSFQGIFLGDGVHTLTFTKGSAESPFSEENCAPFRFVKNATIQNLKVAGNIYTSQKLAAGLASSPYGTTNITNCVVSTNIYSSVSNSSNNDGAHGGFVAMPNSGTLNITGCAYTGRLLTNNSTTNCAGFVGWHNGATISVTGSFYAPSGSIPTGWSAINAGATFVRGGSPTLTNCYYTEALGDAQGWLVRASTALDNLGSEVSNYGMMMAYENGILLDGTYYVIPTLPGSGTEQAPYTISNTDEWNLFATLVNCGTQNYSGKFVKLNADISVTTMTGTSEANSFQGTFLGNDKTLTFTKGSTESPFSEENCAPFRFVKNATIQNLKVAGDIYTSRKFAAGLASRPYGTTNITNCHVSTNIYSTINGDGTHSCFVAMPSGTLSITGSAYTGRLLTNNSTTNCAGFVGWHNGATISVTGSFYAPSGSIPTGWSAINAGATFVRGGSPTLTNCYYTEALGDAQGWLVRASTALDNLGSEVSNYGMMMAYENGILLDGTYYVIPTLPGSGTEQAPYTISNTDEWNLFATLVNCGTQNYSGKYVLLTADISVSNMVGTNSGAFMGIFLGNGKTLTFNNSAWNSNDHYFAPFRYVSGATIQGLRVKGNIYTYQQAAMAGGLVGISYGTTNISDCHVSTVLHGRGDIDEGFYNHGGIVGSHASGALTITGCAYTGALLSDDNEATYGGFVGSSTGSALTITNSLFAPNFNIPRSNNEMNVISGSTFTRKTLYSQTPTITNCYCTYHLTAQQGTMVRAITHDDYVTVANAGNVVNAYPYSGLTFYETGIQCDDTHYVVNGQTVSLTLGSQPNCQVTAFKASAGTLSGSGSFYTLTMPDRDVTISATSLTAEALPGAGTSENPYTISSNSEWETFCAQVWSGNTYSGQFVRLDADIAVSKMVGTSEANSFQGTFLGNGHTLTFTKGSAGILFNEQYCAPFRYTKNATIRDLKVAGDIYTNQKFAAGLVSRPYGTTNITNCRVGTYIYSSINGDGTHGGIIAMPAGSTTIEGCIYTGRLMTFNGTNNCGGFVGWSGDNTATVRNSLYIPSGSIPSGWSVINAGSTFVRGNNPTVINCYYTEKMGDAQGAQALAVGSDTGLGDLTTDYGMVTIYANGVFFDGFYYRGTTLGGEGTEEEPYLINDEFEWRSFALYVNGGNTYSGKFLKLTADIAVSTMADGTFSGTFDGGDHTITANIDGGNAAAALFRTLSGATIKNLTVGGTVSGAIHTAALVQSLANSTDNVIENCTVTATVNCSGTHMGGILGHGNKSNVAIRGCVFSGTMTGGTTAKGVFYGWGDNGGTRTVTDCLYLMADGQDTDGLDLARKNAGTVTVTNCYYTGTLDDAQGTQALYITTEATYVGTLVHDYGIVTAYENGIFFGGKYYRAYNVFSLADDDDNGTTISENDGKVANVTLYGRTLYRDGYWNTLCLPFDVTLSSSPLAGATARPLSEASISESTLNLTFGNAVTTLQAGTPYIIKWDAAAENIVSPVFSGVTIDATDRSYDNGVSGDDRVRFLGTYKSTTFDGEDKSILFMGGSNTLYYPLDGASIGAQRAYFLIGEDGVQARQLTAFRINFGEDETTGIISMDNGQLRVDDPEDVWYTLDGRRLNGKPSRAGVYINKGIKVVIK